MNASNEQEKITKAIDGMVEEIHSKRLMQLQVDMFKCGIDCANKPAISSRQFQSCVEKCHRPLSQIDQIMQSHMSKVQSRVQRCLMACSDKAEDSKKSGRSRSEIEASLDSCADACSNDIIKLVPGLTKDILNDLPK